VEGPTSGNVVEASHQFLGPWSPNRVIRTFDLREFRVDNTIEPPSYNLGDFYDYKDYYDYDCNEDYDYNDDHDHNDDCLEEDCLTIICEVTATVRPDRSVLGCRIPPLNEPEIQVAAKHKKQLQVELQKSGQSEQNELVNARQKSQQLLQNEQGETLTTSRKGQPQNQDKTLPTSQKCQQLNQQLENSFR
jgi:hypothetical protein